MGMSPYQRTSDDENDEMCMTGGIGAAVRKNRRGGCSTGCVFHFMAGGVSSG